MIIYCCADKKYFDLYFDLWASRWTNFYPSYKKMIAVYKPDDEVRKKCEMYNVELRDAKLVDNPTKKHFYLMRWLNLPYDKNEKILQTQINCLPIRQAYDFKQLLKKETPHIRIQRDKGGKREGGLSLGIFNVEAAKQVVDKAKEMLVSPPKGDHAINEWQGKNIKFETIKLEIQVKNLFQKIRKGIYFITATTANLATHEQKIGLLKHYIK